MNTHRLFLNGHSADCTVETFGEVSRSLVEQYGPGVPTAMKIPEDEEPAPESQDRPATVPDPLGGAFTNGVDTTAGDRLADKRNADGHEAVDAEGKARAQANQATAVRVGFALKRRLFEDGTVLWGSGVDAMTRERQDHLALPLAPAAFATLKAQVVGENRRDTTVNVHDIRLDNTGHICLPHSKHGLVPLRATSNATQALLNRAGIPLYTALVNALDTGSRDVVAGIATTFEAWQKHQEEHEAASHANKPRGRGRRKTYTPKQVVVGVRDSADNEREIYRIVSPKFADLPIDRIAEALEKACPSDARCRIDYDGKRLRADVEFFTDVEPKNAVVGETWKAVARISTDDTGGGSIRGDGGIFMALCRNFTYTSSWQSVFALRHMGDVDKLAQEFRKGFDDVMATIAPFIQQWSVASNDDVIAAVKADYPETQTIPLSEMMAGIFAAQIGNARELVPVPGKRADRARQLVSAAQGDRSGAGYQQAGTLTRAGLVNAFTRVAHTMDLSSDSQVEVERAASALLSPAPGRKTPPRLRWIPIASA